MIPDFTLAVYRIHLASMLDDPAKWAQVSTDLRMNTVPPIDSFRRDIAIIDAMTDQERDHPERIKTNARIRIASEANTQPEHVDRLLAAFKMVVDLQKQIDSETIWQRAKRLFGIKLRFPF